MKTCILMIVGFLFSLSLAHAALPEDPVAKLPEYGSESWKDTAIKGMPGDLIWADCFGPYVLIGQNSSVKDTRTIWNIKDRKVLGTITGRFEVEAPFALSPSGKYLACGRGFFNAERIAVFDCVKGKPLYDLKGNIRYEELRYLADDKLAVISTDAVAVWDMKTGKYFGGLKIPGHAGFGGKVFVSPNLKMVGHTNGLKVKLFTPEGKELGEYECPKHKDLFAGNIEAAEFSPDGKHLAMLHVTHQKMAVYLMDLTAEKIGEAIIVGESPHYDHQQNKHIRKLSWSLDGKALLVCQEHVVDPFSGHVLWKFPEHSNPNNRRNLLSVQRGLYTIVGGGNQTLTAIEFDDKQMAEIRNAAATGKTIPDPNLPPLKEVKLPASTVVTIPSSVPYTVKPTPMTLPAKFVQQPIPVETGKHSVGQMGFATGRGLIVVENISTVDHFVHVIRDKAKPVKSNSLDLFDVSTGLRDGRLEFQFGTRYHAISPDGKQIVCIDPEFETRIDVINVQKNAPVVAFRPYGEQLGKKVKFARFVGSDRLLTSNGDTLVVWKLPDGVPEFQLTTKAHAAHLSPSGKLVAILENDGLKILDSSTLNPLGQIDFPAGKEFAKLDFLASNWSGDEKLFLAFHQSQQGKFGGVVSRWNIDTGKAETPIFLPGHYSHSWNGSHSIQPITPEYYLIDNRQILFVPKQELIWNFTSSHDDAHAQEIYGGHWFCTVQDRAKGIRWIMPSNLSIAVMDQWVKTIENSKDVLWQTGSEVALSVSIPQDSETAKKNLANTLTGKGYKVVEMCKNTLDVSATISDTGKKQEYRDMMRPGINAETVSVSIMETKGKARLNVDGKTIWESGFSSQSNAPGFVTLRKDETLDDKINGGMKSAATGWAGYIIPPSKIVATPEGNVALPGHGVFSSRGVEVLPPIIKVNP